MEFRHLKNFVAVAEAECVSFAATNLRISQPSLSRQMRDLEDSLGVALFRRSPNSLRMTDAGRAFLEEAKAILVRVDVARRNILNYSVERKLDLTVGHVPILASGMIPNLLKSLKESAPDLRVKLIEESAAALIAGARDGRFDVTLSPRPRVRIPSGLAFEELCRFRPGVFVPPTHRFAKAKHIRPREIASEPLVVPTLKNFANYNHYLTAVFRIARAKPRIAMESDTGAGLMVAAASGYGIAVMFELPRKAAPGLEFIPFEGGPPPLSFGILRRAGAPAPGVSSFVAMARLWAGGKRSTNPADRHAPSDPG